MEGFIKINKKGFTLIELLAVIVILAILVAVSIPAVTKYLETARKGTYTSNAQAAISAVRNDVISSGLTTDDSYTLTEINSLLEKKLTTSSYGSAYVASSAIYVTFDVDGIASYSICLPDADGNGIFVGTAPGAVTAVAETNITSASVKTGIGTVTCP